MEIKHELYRQIGFHMESLVRSMIEQKGSIDYSLFGLFALLLAFGYTSHEDWSMIINTARMHG
ncbi:hypothetical protein AAZX31_18G040700 [Glycine max]